DSGGSPGWVATRELGRGFSVGVALADWDRLAILAQVHVRVGVFCELPRVQLPIGVVLPPHCDERIPLRAQPLRCVLAPAPPVWETSTRLRRRSDPPEGSQPGKSSSEARGSRRWMTAPHAAATGANDAIRSPTAHPVLLAVSSSLWARQKIWVWF